MSDLSAELSIFIRVKLLFLNRVTAAINIVAAPNLDVLWNTDESNVAGLVFAE